MDSGGAGGLLRLFGVSGSVRPWWVPVRNRIWFTSQSSSRRPGVHREVGPTGEALSGHGPGRPPAGQVAHTEARDVARQALGSRVPWALRVRPWVRTLGGWSSFFEEWSTSRELPILDEPPGRPSGGSVLPSTLVSTCTPDYLSLARLRFSCPVPPQLHLPAHRPPLRCG